MNNPTDIHNFDEIVHKCYELYERSSFIERNVYNDVWDLVYDSEENYMHYYPRSLFLQLTSGCNLRCKHCFYSDSPEKYDNTQDLNEEELFTHLKYFVEEVNILYCTITGGEIFTSPFLLKVIKYLKENSVTIKLVTNGTLITKEISDELAKYLTKHDVLQISLEAPEKELNDNIRGIGVFDKVINSINYLTANKLNVEIGFTVNALNVNSIPQMYEMAKKLKVKRLNIGRFSLESPNQAFLVPETEDIFISLAKLQEIYDGSIQLLIPCIKIPDFLKFPSGIKLMNKRLGNCNKNRTNFHCKSHHEQVTLFSNGNIALCYDCNINDLIIGNLRKQTFDEIWQNRFENPMFKPRTIHNHLCKKCKYISLCLSGCPYRAYIKYGTTEAPGIECNYFKELEGEPV